MTNTKREWKFPGYNVVCDDDDNALSEACATPEAARAAGREIATKRGEIVYAYLGNGREAIEPAPSVGMGATVVHAVDRYAGTIIAVSKSGHKVTVREDKAIRTDNNGMSQEQSYRYEPDPNGREWTFYRKANGRYATGGSCPYLAVATRSAYHCYEF